ncbi:hypothetical protein II906_08620 [bacterium]|nr:hypothetical protein [bacterium]
MTKIGDLGNVIPKMGIVKACVPPQEKPQEINPLKDYVDEKIKKAQVNFAARPVTKVLNVKVKNIMADASKIHDGSNFTEVINSKGKDIFAYQKSGISDYPVIMDGKGMGSILSELSPCKDGFQILYNGSRFIGEFHTDYYDKGAVLLNQRGEIIGGFNKFDDGGFSVDFRNTKLMEYHPATSESEAVLLNPKGEIINCGKEVDEELATKIGSLMLAYNLSKNEDNKERAQSLVQQGLYRIGTFEPKPLYLD